MDGFAILLLATLAVLLTINLPVAFAIALSSLVFLVAKGIPIQTLVQRLVNGTDSFPLLAIPFFILAGELMNRGGITRRLVKLASAMVGHLTGGLAHVNIVTNTMMSGMSGSSVADAAGIAKVMVPVMEQGGYSRSFAAAVTAAGATIAPIIPPSIGMIIYAAMTGTSVGRLFIGGIVPGILMSVSLMCVAYWVCRSKGYTSHGAEFSWKALFAGFREAFFALMLPLIILFGIRGGVFTPTEAAAVAAVYAAFIGVFVYGEITIADVPKILSDAAIGTAVIGLIMAAATPLGWILTWQRVPQMITEGVISMTSDPNVIYLLLNAVLLVLGCFMDATAIMIMLVPIMLPIIVNAGIDPVHFGLVLIINLMVGGLTPPYGILLFTVSGITGVPVMSVVREVLPFIGALVALLFIITYLPSIVLFLPDLLMGTPR
jgi:tripartite ATP-independent transporter DctM subunit